MGAIMVYLIYETKTKAELTTVIKIIDAVAVTYWKSKGYNINRYGNLISKKGDIDNPDATTNEWAIPEKSPDGTWFCPSLSNDPAYAKGHTQVFEQCRKLGIEVVEKEMPKEWEQTYG